MTLEDKLQSLREEYRNSPEKRQAILLQVRVLKMAESIKEEEDFETQVKTTLIPRAVVNGYQLPIDTTMKK